MDGFGGMQRPEINHAVIAQELLKQINFDPMYWLTILLLVGLFLICVPRQLTWMWYSRKVTYEGRTVLITGASSGIGEEMTKQMLDQGAKKVIIAGRQVSELKRVKDECKDKKGDVEIWELDMSNPELVYHEGQKFARTIDALDLLVNNAGVNMRKKFIDFEFESCQKIMNTNCSSHIALTKAMIPVLRASGQGQIVFMSSIAGLVGTGMQSMYSSAKFALTGFARSIRPELKDVGIHVTLIYPGKIRTDFSQKAVTGINRTYG